MLRSATSSTIGRLAGPTASVNLITAHDDVVTQQQSLSDGAANYLRKPLRGDVLVRSIHESIARAGGAAHSGLAGGHQT